MSKRRKQLEDQGGKVQRVVRVHTNDAVSDGGEMNKRNRDRLLRVAKWLDRRAAWIRQYVKRKTPKRVRRIAET